MKNVEEKVIALLCPKPNFKRELSGMKCIECGMIQVAEYLRIICKNKTDVTLYDENSRPVGCLD